MFFLTACTEDVNLTVVGGSSKIVIEGNIENDKYAEVSVTRNSSLSATLDTSKIFVKDAKVYVSNGIVTDTLQYKLSFDAPYFFAYVGSKIKGVAGGSYNLTVVADGKTYTATTTIPTPVKLDSVWWKPQLPEDSLGFAWAHLSEPAGLGNAYRWYAKKPLKFEIVNGLPFPVNRRFAPPFGATFDDKFVDGKSFDLAYSRSYDPTEVTFTKDEPEKERGYYKITDTIYIKFCTIDLDAAKFYNTYEQALQTNGNPFSSPTSILSNISNDGLGVWAGFGATYDTILPQ